jgi:hypothetical protein
MIENGGRLFAPWQAAARPACLAAAANRVEGRSLPTGRRAIAQDVPLETGCTTLRCGHDLAPDI